VHMDSYNEVSSGFFSDTPPFYVVN
jgi:hypothetical protein